MRVFPDTVPGRAAHVKVCIAAHSDHLDTHLRGILARFAIP